MIGSIQALETIKVLIGQTPMANRMIIYDGRRGETRTIRTRGAKAECLLCGTNKEITELIDYQLFCEAGAHDKDQDLKLLDSSMRMSPRQLNEMNHQNALIIDVRFY